MSGDLLLGLGALTVWIALTLDTHMNHPHVLMDDWDCLHVWWPRKDGSVRCLYCEKVK